MTEYIACAMIGVGFSISVSALLIRLGEFVESELGPMHLTEADDYDWKARRWAQ